MRRSRIVERALTDAERAACGDDFDAALLDAARVIDGRVPFWLRPDMVGVTLGDRIYFRRGAYDPCSTDGLALLAHELAHVRQYRQGMTIWKYLWASRRGYWRNAYEVEARAVEARVAAQLVARAAARVAADKPSIARPTASATSMPSIPADMIPPA